MAWLVIARVDGISDSKQWPRIVSDTSWKGWPKVKDFAGNVNPEQRMAGKNVVHVIGVSEDGKTIAPELTQPKKATRPLVAPPEVQEIIAKRTSPLEGALAPDGLTEAPPAVEEVAPVRVEEPAPVVKAKKPIGRPKKVKATA